MEKALSFDYTNFGRDILFEGIQPSSKDKKKRDFLDCCKCLVWEENRTRYELDESFRKKIDLSRCFANSLKEEGALEKWMDASVELTTELEFYRTKFPFNVSYFPKKPYLKYKYTTRKKWIYDPTEGRQKYCRKLLFEGLTGDNEADFHEAQKIKLIGNKYKPKGREHYVKEINGKIISRTVPVTIHIDPLIDPVVSKQIVNQNFAEILKIADLEKERMEKNGYEFLSKKQVVEMKKIQKEFVEFHGGVFSAFDPIFKPKTLNVYNSGLQFLGLYRLLECRGLKWNQVEKIYDKYFNLPNSVPMSLHHYKYKVKSVLRLFEHKEHLN